MASIMFYSAIVLVVFCGYLESRPQNYDIMKTITAGKNNDWKDDKDYAFTWKEGSFTLGTPEHATCPMVMQPENGRFVCSVGTILERSMCLVECKTNFEQDKPPVVYICEQGKWYDLKRSPISTPEPQCVPKPVMKHEFAE